jgi:hypothetical protein
LQKPAFVSAVVYELEFRPRRQVIEQTHALAEQDRNSMVDWSESSPDWRAQGEPPSYAHDDKCHALAQLCAAKAPDNKKRSNDLQDTCFL